MINRLYFAIDAAVHAFTADTFDVYAGGSFKADVLTSCTLTADDKTSDFYDSISQTDSRFCIWQRF